MVKIVVANLKMNFTLAEVADYLEKVKEIEDDNLIICPSFIYLPYFTKKTFKVGAQNCFYENKGAFTGEISPTQLKSTGVDYVIIAHSERRHFFQENNEIIRKKVQAALGADLRVIYCLGETEAEKNSGQTIPVLEAQLKIIFDDFDNEQKDKIMIAYEPVWAIGTGNVPKTSELEKTLQYLKEKLKTTKDLEIKVLYGGSINENNIAELAQIKNLDGFLIGGASNDPSSLRIMLNKVRGLLDV